MPLRARDLFEAYQDDELPREGGAVLTSALLDDGAYCRYELIAYRDARAFFLSEDGLTFQADGNKLYLLAEPASFTRKGVEPLRREAPYQIPHRFSELEIVTARNGTRIMASRDPILVYSAFTVLRPGGLDFAFLFYSRPDALDTIAGFLSKTLSEEAQVPPADAAEAALRVTAILKRFPIRLDTAP